MKKLLLISILSSVLVLGACSENKESAEGEENPKQEVKNLEDIMTFEELTKNKPTLEWKQRMDEDDDLFTDENINATNEVLDSYINSLKVLRDNPTEEEILECVKKVVISLNELNENYDYFIETMEREELYEFITEAARIAGFESEEDITEEWREW
ncbi:hypothetical protein SAMN05444673_3086 [Bacillus sp. OV166]|nr:hypothetical protein SAMN05444673_3086 [Bacillus sp. OV166]